MSCPVCDGTGLVLQDICPLCDGEDPLHNDDEAVPLAAIIAPKNDKGDGLSSKLTQSLCDPRSCDAVCYVLPASSESESESSSESSAEGSESFDAICDATVYTSTRPPTQAEAEMLARGLTIAGAALEAPRFHVLCRQWKVRQCFADSDDPDRTKEIWQSPSFAFGDASRQRAKTSVEELRVPGGGFARVVHNVLDPGHCASLISLCNAKGFTPALINIGGGKQRLAPVHRDGFRVIADDDSTTAYLFEVLKPYIPERLDSADVVGLNRRCRFLCYTPGQVFPVHQDGCYCDPSGAFSKVTVQVYLHDVPLENGGATTFIFRDGCQSKCRLPCQPRAGSVLVFSQCLEHEGSRLARGLKYTMRTEVMYARRARGQASAAKSKAK